MAKKKYLVKSGISWYDGGRAEPGEIVDNIPRKSIGWLLEQGHIEEVDPDTKPDADKQEGDAE